MRLIENYLNMLNSKKCIHHKKMRLRCFRVHQQHGRDCPFRKIKPLIYYSFLLCFIAFSHATAQPNVPAVFKANCDRIIKAALDDSLAWEQLAEICDSYGPRLSGSTNLNLALFHVMRAAQQENLYQNIQLDEVMLPHWVRGKAFCNFISTSPAFKARVGNSGSLAEDSETDHILNRNIPILALGSSIGTKGDTLHSQFIVIKNFAELDSLKDKIAGKIVVYNYDYKNYGQAVEYRFAGASRAARYGAVACLVRSVTPMGMNNLHAGVMFYIDSFPKIPAIAIATEDANFLQRVQERSTGKLSTATLELYVEADTLPDKKSYNLSFELTGSEKPDEIIAMGGHLDSWDNTVGAHDDAGGCVTTWHALQVLAKLGIKPKRTIRNVFWVNEENGNRGGRAYAAKHGKENHKLVFEFDSGVFPPSAIRYTGPDSLFNSVKLLEPYLNRIDSMIVGDHGGGVDISPMMQLGVPSMSLSGRDDGKYFWYHHCPSDVPESVKSEDLRKCIAAIAISIYYYSLLP